MLRLPYLLASVSSFALNPHVYLDVVLRAALRIGSSFDDVFSLHALPVDLCARWVARMVLAPEVPLVVHVFSYPPVEWRDWIDAASALGEPLLWSRWSYSMAVCEKLLPHPVAPIYSQPSLFLAWKPLTSAGCT